MPQMVPPLMLTTDVIEVVASSFPALKTLALSGMDEAVPGQPEVQLQPLSELTGLTDLSIAARQIFSASTLASLSSLKQLAGLKLELRNGADDAFLRISPHLSSLWGLRLLTQLSCIDISGSIEEENDEPAYDSMVTTLVGCRQLASLCLPWAVLMNDAAAERLATELPQLTRLSVESLWPNTTMPPCSWRVLTLCGEIQDFGCLLKLPSFGRAGAAGLHGAHCPGTPRTVSP